MVQGEISQIGAIHRVGGRRVGVVTSVARHADMGPIALAVVFTCALT